MTKRRIFLGAAAVATAGGAIAQSKSEPSQRKPAVELKFQSAFVGDSMNDLMATRFAEFVNAAGGSRVHMAMLPADSMAKSGDLMDVVNSGRLDGVFDTPYNWSSKHAAVGLWGANPTFGMNGHVMSAWHYYGGGKELLNEIYQAMGVDVVSFPCVALPTKPLGWFKKPVTKVGDLAGLRFRVGGLAAEVMKELGIDPVNVPGTEIASALQVGKLDGAEWNDVSSDRAINLRSGILHCMLQSFHEPATMLEVLISKKRWATLPADVQAILENAAHMVSETGFEEFAHKNAIDYEKLVREGASFFKSPQSVLHAQLNAWDKVIQRRSAADPLFAKVVSSQRDFARRAVKWKMSVDVDYRIAHNYYSRLARA